MEKHAVARLIGAPPGYVGYEEGGQLTEVVRRRPYSVILFDEIEKAHHDVFNVLLQILDDGRLTDSQGRTVDFKNTVLIMTSNIGSMLIQEGMAGKKQLDESIKQAVMEALQRQFRPEFINRVDEIVIFEALRKEEITQIVDLQLERLRKLLADKRLTLEVEPSARQFLAERGYDPVYGARPLKRAIQKYLQDPLALKVLSGELTPGDTVVVQAGQNALRLNRKPRA
jgi:ATP-dependent Clp protease ATP-binding subunit ClpB